MKANDRSFHALGDPTRRTILGLLRDGPQSVGAIAGMLPVTQPAVSQHLKVLREAGLVTVRKEGTNRVYAVDPAGLVPVRAFLDSFWDAALGAFADAAYAQASRAGSPNRHDRPPLSNPDSGSRTPK